MEFHLTKLLIQAPEREKEKKKRGRKPKDKKKAENNDANAAVKENIVQGGFSGPFCFLTDFWISNGLKILLKPCLSHFLHLEI